MAMPGIQTKLNIPKTQSPKEVASTAVLHASRATTFSKPTSSSGNIFGSTGTRYGISAQRSKVGTGQHLNAKAFYNNNNTSALRDMNSRAFFSVDSYAPVFIEHNHNSNKMSGLEKALMWTTAGLGIAGMAMSTINAFKTPDNSIKRTSLVDSEIPTADGVKGSNVPESLTAMKGAKDSSTLRDSIGIAEADKTRMEAELEELKSTLPTMKDASEAATKKLAELKPKVAEAKEAIDTAEANKKDAESVKNANEEALDAVQGRLTGAKEGLVKAKNSLMTEKRTLGSAKAMLAATPKTNADGSKNPAYQNAEHVVELAEKAVKDAEQKFSDANAAYNAATEDEQKAKSDFEIATEQLAKSEEHCAEMQKKFELLDKEYKELERQQSEAQKTVNDYNNALTRQTELKSHISQLESEIPAQQKRLTELEQKEEKGYDAATNTILQMQNKMAGKDGILGTGDDKKKLGKKDQEKYDNAIKLQRNVGYTKLRKMAVDSDVKAPNGNEFRKGTFSVGGKQETLYMINNKPVTKEEYNRAASGTD